MNANPIEDFILSNERNLEIAFAVSEATATARRKVVAAFFDRLGARILQDLKGWKFAYQQGWFVDKDRHFYVWKPDWNEEYTVDLCSYDHIGEEMILGVSRERDVLAVKRRGHCDQVLAAIKKVHPSARATNWWEAWADLTIENGDWSKPNVLWRMHTDSKFLEEVAAELLEVAKIAAPILDRFIKKR